MKKLLDNHVAVSQYFDLLEDHTVSSVQFLDLKYNAYPGNPISIEMRGKTSSYASVAEQETALLKNPDFSEVSFTGLALSESGGVGFTLKAHVKEGAIKFGNLVGPISVPVIPAPKVATSTTATSSAATATATSTGL